MSTVSDFTWTDVDSQTFQEGGTNSSTNSTPRNQATGEVPV